MATTSDMTNKVAIVTGANTGIGYETALGMARAGAAVVLACRNAGRAEEAKARMLAAAPDAKLDVLPVDLGSQQAIRGFVAAFEASFDRLDVLVNNAALLPARRSTTVDGHETQLAVNHLGPFLLTNLLLPRLQAAAPSRVVVVSSRAHKGAKLDLDDLESTKEYSSLSVYGRTKLMNLLFVRALARRLEGTGVTVNALHPGVVSTEIARDFPLPFRMFARIISSSPAKGARTSLFLALDPGVQGTSGRYFVKQREEAPDPAALDDAVAERLWQLSAQLVSLPPAS